MYVCIYTCASATARVASDTPADLVFFVASIYTYMYIYLRIYIYDCMYVYIHALCLAGSPMG